MRPQERIMLVGFDEWWYIFSEPTSEEILLDKAIKRIKGGSGTSIYQAVAQFCSTILPKIGGQKTLILFSDGIDVTSKTDTLTSSIYQLRRSNTALSSIYYDSHRILTTQRKTARRPATTVLQRILRNLPISIGLSLEESKLGKRYVQELVFASGGRMFDSGDSKERLKLAFTSALKTARNQKYIEYVSNQPKPLKQARKIKVRVNRPNLTVHIRDAYF